MVMKEDCMVCVLNIDCVRNFFVMVLCDERYGVDVVVCGY